MGTETCAVTGTNSTNVYFCKCSQSRCSNPNLPHYGMCSVCYLRGKTPKQRREFWRVLGQHFNGVSNEKGCGQQGETQNSQAVADNATAV